MNTAGQNNTSMHMEEEISRKEKIINDYKNKIQHQTNEIKLKDSQIKNIESKLVNKDTIINYLENQLKTANFNFDYLTHKINDAADEYNLLNDEINKKENEFRNNEKKLKNEIKIRDNEIHNLKEDLNKKENDLTIIKDVLNHQINIKQKELDEEKKKFNSLERAYRKNLSKLENKEYIISCYKEETSNNQLEIKYLKNNNITKKILTPIAYLYLVFKSKPKEISLNIKLYKVLKDSKFFDIGFYLNKNKDLINSNWYKYFSPELHYVCNGFNENRKLNKKDFNRNSKKELLEYLLNCDE